MSSYHRNRISAMAAGLVERFFCSQSVAAAAGTQTGSSIIVSTSNLCEHQPEHDDECGYSEGTTGTACSHENTDDCYTEVLKCVHKHDDECGYSPATRGTPCEFAWDGKEK